MGMRATRRVYCPVLAAKLDEKVNGPRLLWHALRSRWSNRQTMRRAWEVGRAHYDIGNEFYRSMLVW